jgi:hypothetical protein
MCDCEHTMASEFEAPEYVVDGQDVYIYWNREKDSILRCTVALSCGNMVRVVNENHRVDKWLCTDDLLVPTIAIMTQIMET